MGASLRLEHKLDDIRLVTVKFGAYNGQGESLNDVNNKKSFGARATAAVTPKIDVGAVFLLARRHRHHEQRARFQLQQQRLGHRRPVREARR